MADYELFYGEIRYYDASKSWQTSVEKSVLIPGVAKESDAITFAKMLINNIVDDPLVMKRIPIKLVRIIPVDSWK